MPLIKLSQKLFPDKKIDQSFFSKKNIDQSFVVLSLLLGLYLEWETQNIVLFAYFIWLILNPVSSRFLAKVTLCCIALVPLLLFIHREFKAGQFAILAYYLLVLTAIVKVIETHYQNAGKKAHGKAG